MKPEYILKANLLDIIFENKNKEYGAYSLRRHYNERLYKSLAIIFLAAIILGCIGYLYKTKTSPSIFDSPEPYMVKVFEMPNEAVKPPEPPKPQEHSVSPAAPTTDSKPKVDNHNLSKFVLSNDGDEIPAPVSGEADIPNAGPHYGTGEPTHSWPATVDGGTVSSIDKSIPQAADIMPVFPGGIEALRKFLKNNLVTPAKFESEETVVVKIQFIVGYDGELKGFSVMEDGGAVFNNEVIRVLKKMPAWIPGKAHGVNVSVYYTIPVVFTSEE